MCGCLSRLDLIPSLSDLIPLLHIPTGERGLSRARACNCSLSRNSFMVWWISFSSSIAQLNFWESWRPVHPFMARNHGYKLPGGRAALVEISRDAGIGADTDGFCVSVRRDDVMTDDSWAISLMCVNNLCTFWVGKIMYPSTAQPGKDWASCLPCNSNSTAWFHDSVRFVNNYSISFGQKSWCNLRWPADLQRAYCKDCSILQVCTTQHQKDQALSDRACCTTSCPGPCHF